MVRSGLAALVAAIGALAAGAAAAAAPEFLPTGQFITPAAAKGALFQPLNPGLAELPNYTVGQASAVALSPDGRTLLILTSGFNRTFSPDGKLMASASSEFVFVYDIAGPTPVKRQAPLLNPRLGNIWGSARTRTTSLPSPPA